MPNPSSAHSDQELEAGEWYFVITCETCEAKHVLFRDLNGGRTPIMAVYTWKCPKCHHLGFYDSRNIELYYHLGTKPSSG
jgi:hypothetical protein